MNELKTKMTPVLISDYFLSKLPFLIYQFLRYFLSYTNISSQAITIFITNVTIKINNSKNNFLLQDEKKHLFRKKLFENISKGIERVIINNLLFYSRI